MRTLGTPAAAPLSEQNVRISSALASASMNSTSAPASANAAARASASSRLMAWRASVRATIRMSAPSFLEGGYIWGLEMRWHQLNGLITERAARVPPSLLQASKQPHAGKARARHMRRRRPARRGHLASTAARMRDTASSLDTTRLLRTWPQLLGDTWSSIRMPGGLGGATRLVSARGRNMKTQVRF